MLADIWKYGRWVLAGLIVAALGVSYFSVKILTLQRDEARDATTVAQGEAQAARRESILITTALEQARKDDHDREDFITETTQAIATEKPAGDGALAPVLRDTVDRVRRRYQARAGAQ